MPIRDEGQELVVDKLGRRAPEADRALEMRIMGREVAVQKTMPGEDLTAERLRTIE
jgi:hypothetical protein